MVEAPITGGLSALKTGTMVTYLGGDRAVVDLVSPILSVGDPGAQRLSEERTHPAVRRVASRRPVVPTGALMLLGIVATVGMCISNEATARLGPGFRV